MSLSLVPFPGASSPIKMEKEAIQRQADHCNDRKMASKRVQELSADLFFAIFVRVRAKTIFPLGMSGFPHEGSATGQRAAWPPSWPWGRHTVRGCTEQPPQPELQDLETLAHLRDGWMGDAAVVTILSLGRSVVLWSQRPW